MRDDQAAGGDHHLQLLDAAIIALLTRAELVNILADHLGGFHKKKLTTFGVIVMLRPEPPVTKFS